MLHKYWKEDLIVIKKIGKLLLIKNKSRKAVYEISEADTNYGAY